MRPGSSTGSVYWRRGVAENLLVFDTVPLAVYDHLKTLKSVNDFEELSQKLKPGSKVAIVPAHTRGGKHGQELPGIS